MTPRHALVFGASGLIGRYLILALAEAGAEVTAAVRTAASGERVERWLREHGLTRDIRTTIVDFDAPEIVPGGAAAFASVTEIHNCAGSFRFGMTAAEARDANVGIVENLIDFASGLPHLQRVVHISGYRVGGQDPAAVPWPDARNPASARSATVSSVSPRGSRSSCSSCSKLVTRRGVPKVLNRCACLR